MKERKANGDFSKAGEIGVIYNRALMELDNLCSNLQLKLMENEQVV